jgi:predicted RNase H-like HicB family nuclease
MNADAIKKTAAVRKQGGDYIVQSPLCPDVIGAGDTEPEAWQIFEEILEDYLADHKAGRVAKGRGRPKESTKRKTRQISLPDDVATWLMEDPARIEKVRALIAN